MNKKKFINSVKEKNCGLTMLKVKKLQRGWKKVFKFLRETQNFLNFSPLIAKFLLKKFIFHFFYLTICEHWCVYHVHVCITQKNDSICEMGQRGSLNISHASQLRLREKKVKRLSMCFLFESATIKLCFEDVFYFFLILNLRSIIN